MATAELVIAFGAKLDGLEASLKRVNTRFDELETSAKKTSDNISKSVDATNSSFARLTTTIRATIAAAVAFGAVRMATDLILAIDNVNTGLTRLQFLLGGSRDAARITFDELANVSKRTGASVESLMDQFVRFRVALNALGMGNQEVIRITETLANYARVSGARAQEAQNAIVQLGQGLASGKLAGDELKSILENMPLFAQDLARAMGVTVGELRKMGEEGKLSAEKISDAIKKMADDIEKRLAGIPLNIMQSFEALKTSFLQLVQYIDSLVGSSSGIATLLRLAQLRFDGIRVALGGANAGERIAFAEAEERDLQTRLTQLRRELAEIGEAPPPVRPGIPGVGPSRTAPSEDTATRERILREIATTERRINVIRQEGVDERQAIAESDAMQRIQQQAEARRQQESQGRALNQTQLAAMDQRVRINEEADKRIQDAYRIHAAGMLRDAQGNAQTLQQRVDEINRRREAAIDDVNERESAQSREDQARRIRESNRVLDQREAMMARISSQDREVVRNMQQSFDRIRNPDQGSVVGSAIDVYMERVRAGSADVATIIGAVTSEAQKAGETLVRAGRSAAPVYAELAIQVDYLRGRLIAAGVAEVEVDRAIAQSRGELDASLKRITDRQEGREARAGAAAQRRAESEATRRARQMEEARQNIRDADRDAMRGLREAFQARNTVRPGTMTGIGTDAQVFINDLKNNAVQVGSLIGSVTSEAEKAGESLIRAFRPTTEVMAEMNRQLDAYRQMLVDAGISTVEFDRVREESVNRMNQNLERVRERGEKTFQDIAEAGVRTFSSDLAGSIIDFAATGEGKFEEMAANFGKMVAKMILELLILKAVVLGLRAIGFEMPGINIGVSQPSTGTSRMAGGTAYAGGSYWVGEDGPERFSPGVSGYITPNMEGGGKVEVNIYNQTGSAVRTQESSDPFGNKQISVFIEEAVKKGISSGKFDGTMRQQYGLTRPGRI